MESQTKKDNAMTEQEEFEFRLRLEQEAGQEQSPFTLIGDQPPPPTMGEFATESIGRTLSSIPALMAESSALYGLSGGEFPSNGQAYRPHALPLPPRNPAQRNRP